MSTPATRDDPYGAFNFRIMWDGGYVAGASLVTGMESNEAVEATSSPGHVHYEPVILEGIVTGDSDFLGWARISASDIPESFDERDTKQLVIEQYVEHNLRATHTLYDCWVSEYQAVPEPDAHANLIPIQTLRLEHGGVHVRPAG